jgi:Flp pilus assembly protein TadG
MIRHFQQFLRDERGGPAAEFAMVLPILIIFLLGTIDVGRLMWDWNKAEKATQMGVRYAVVTDMVPSALETYSFAISGSVAQGERVPKADFPGIICDAPGGTPACSCVTGGTCDNAYLATVDATAFNNIVDRINLFKPDVAAENVVVEYGYSGLGFAGDPNGPDVAPLVTIRLQNLDFQPLLTQIFGTTITLPDFSAALTLEDGDGTYSN